MATTLPPNSSVVVFTGVLCVVNFELGFAVGSRTLLGSHVNFCVLNNILAIESRYANITVAACAVGG